MPTMEGTMNRKRSDYRTTTGDRFMDYLIGSGAWAKSGGYPAHEDWTPNVHEAQQERDFRQPHHTARSGGRFVHVDGGKPAMREGVLDRLSGTPWQAVALSIESVRAWRPDVVAALEWMAKAEGQRLNRYEFAFTLHCSDRSISTWARLAADQTRKGLWEARKLWWAQYDRQEPG